MSSAQPSQSTLKPSAPRQPSTSAQKPSTPKAPVSAHPTATVSDSITFQGTYPVSIGAGSVIHPRVKIYSFEGPVSIGEGCIVGEKSTIGNPQPTPKTDQDSSVSTQSSPIIIEDFVILGPTVNITTGAHIHTAATIDPSVSLGKGARIGEHAKVCAGCQIPDNMVVDDWTVIWGGSPGVKGGTNLQRRRRAKGHGNERELGPGSVETGRLLVLNKERESLTKLVGGSPALRKR